MSNEQMRVRKKKKSNFTQVSNELLHDTRLSWKAKGIMSYLLSLPDDWIIYFSEVTTHSKDGVTAFRSGIKELKEYGYLERIPVRDDDTKRIIYWETLLVEEPSKEIQQKEKPHVEKPHVQNLHSGKCETTNTVINNTLLNNTNNTNNNLPFENAKEEKVSKNSKYKYEEFDMNMANLLLALMKENNPTFNDSRTNLESWANEFRLLRTKDSKEEKTIEYLLRWCQGNRFWKTNILSADTFREKWDRLYMQSKDEYERKQNKNQYNSYQQKQQALPIEDKNEYDDLSL